MLAGQLRDLVGHLSVERRRAAGGAVDIHQHLLAFRQAGVLARPIQAVVDMQAFGVIRQKLCTHLHPLALLHLRQEVEVTFQGVQGVPGTDAAGFVQTQHIHQRIGGVAEDQQVEGIAQMAVVVDPVGGNTGAVGGKWFVAHFSVAPEAALFPSPHSVPQLFAELRSQQRAKQCFAVPAFAP